MRTWEFYEHEYSENRMRSCDQRDWKKKKTTKNQVILKSINKWFQQQRGSQIYQILHKSKRN